MRMRAIQISRFGDPSVLVPVEVPDPQPGDEQALVDVEVVSISFIETRIRAGRPGPFPLPELPFMPGNGVGGVVRSVGRNADPNLIGQRVFTTTGGSGAYAAKVTVDVAGLVPIPDALTTTEAVALATDGRTAIGLFRLAAPVAGEWVLVEAAAGGLGSLLVQLARRADAQVIGAVGSSAKVKIVSKAGAVAVEYGKPDWVDRVRDLTGGLDVVFDGVGGAIGAAAAGLSKPEGRFVIHGAASGAMTDPLSVAGRVFTLRDVQGSPTDLARAALASGLTPLIGQVFPLERAADAHAAIEARATVGKTLLIV